ncbi:MAG: TetR/AcrR family transcriptional regulator [Myxococcota bacterium]
MRYPKEHREKVRSRILREAGRLFRRRGYDGVGIDGIMSAARLTRGGFYGYFRSKAQLFAEVLAGEHDLLRRLRARTGSTRDERAAATLELLGAYLAPANREAVGRGCCLASVSSDVARAGAPARAAYTELVRSLAREIEADLVDPCPDDPRALASLALCVGGVILSRGVGDPELADRIERTAYAAVEDQLTRPTRV